MNLRLVLILCIATVFVGCATYANFNYDLLFGQPLVRGRTVSIDTKQASFFQNEVKPIIDNRCVVCHACYDAPCQLKLSSVEGIDRGATKARVYEGTRLTAAAPTRLFKDAKTTQEWRDAGFHPVLNERDQSMAANLDAGLMARLLVQKVRHPLPDHVPLEGFDFSIARKQTCPTIEEYEQYAKDNPTWGMPFGMPNLTNAEYLTLMTWLGDGAVMNITAPVSQDDQTKIDLFESFLNDGSLKHQLMARYIYEHLFLSHLYFSDINQKRTPRFYSLVRSSTPPGQPVNRIATRRPYDAPGTDRVYYRIIPERATIVDKTHMPYGLNQQRIDNWQRWFITPDYSVNQLPSYEPKIAANPMSAFLDIPVKSRFKFMLDNAQNTIMAYIKGPVCRGQLALNVINDHFWVFFLDPDKTDIPAVNEFYRSQAENLALPGELESNTLPVTNWVKYARQQARYLEAKADFINQGVKSREHPSVEVIWDGYGVNPNAALTVFRHFDSASVVQGLVGEQPKTAWILDYALLERIHYLLVTGFDVYGNFGHQLITRMFMDFLRMEGESNFISFLPANMRHELQSSWYQDQSPQLKDFLLRNVKPFNRPTNIVYTTDDPKSELLTMLQERLSPVLTPRYEIANTTLSNESERQLKRIAEVRGVGLKPVPQITMLMVRSQSGPDELFTLLHNNAHTNITSLFNEESNRNFSEDSMTIVRGVIGSYPAAFFSIEEAQISSFVEQFGAIQNEADYVKLLNRFSIRRSSEKFWRFSDRLHDWYRTNQPIEFGLLDYNRFENR